MDPEDFAPRDLLLRALLRGAVAARKHEGRRGGSAGPGPGGGGEGGGMGRLAEEEAERVSLEIEAEGSEEDGGMLGGPAGAGTARVSKRDVAKHFAVMGWTAFGGPAAHIAVFEKVFVQDRRWLTSGVFTEFLALGQCIPGPTSTQMAFAIGVVKQGIPGGLLSGGMFLHPGFIIMSIIGATSGGHLEAPSAQVRGLVAGFTAVAIALVAVAALGLGRKICTDRITVAICTATVAATLYYQKPWVLPLLMLSGGVVTTAAYWRKQMAASDTDSGSITSLGLSMRAGGGLLAAWAALLVVLIAILEATGRQGVWPPVAWFKIFYTAGSLIFGGGQVLLPLLLDEMTGTAGCSAGAACKPLMNEAQFYAGLAAAQVRAGAGSGRGRLLTGEAADGGGG